MNATNVSTVVVGLVFSAVRRRGEKIASFGRWCGRRRLGRSLCRAFAIMLVTGLFAGSARAGEVVLDRKAAEAIAIQKGWVVRSETADGRVIELQRIVNHIPLYYATRNLDAAESLRTNECWPGGSSGFGLNGAGITLGVWDGGAVRGTHREFSGRAAQRDSPPQMSGHSTHVAGTMIGAGLWVYTPLYPQWATGQSRGMSYAAALDCYDWNSDTTEMAEAADAGLRVSNHSYGLIAGWSYDSGAWYWYGDVTVSPTEDYYFGFYDSSTAEWDTLACEHPAYLFVVAAGNDRNEGPAPGTGHYYFDPATYDWTWSTDARSFDGRSGYDSISHQSLSKNGLLVGAVYDVNGYSGPGSVHMTDFSCWGPTDDGRIKPDVVGNGTDLFSCYGSSDTTYIAMSGTSMASPNVSGSLGLLVQQHRNTHPAKPDMRAATLKGLVIHTADECGPADGPDYRFGWGLVNTRRAAGVIAEDAIEPQTIDELGLADGMSFEMQLTADGTSSELRATICWTDPAGSPVAPSLNPPDKMLVNDLDLRIEAQSSGSTYMPWVLDPADPGAPATLGDNNTDNVEQVVISDPQPGTYTLRVTHKGSLTGGGQYFSLIITGASTLMIDCNGNGLADFQDIAAGTSRDCEQDGVPDECEVPPLGFLADCNGNGTPDECDFVSGASLDCNGNGIPDECDIAAGISEDCNLNGIPDECELQRLLRQDPDQANAYMSDADPMPGNTVAYSMAENFSLTEPRTINTLVIWGLYVPNSGDSVTDAFTVSVLEDDRGLPGAVISSESSVVFSRTKTGAILFGYDEWTYSMALANPVMLSPGTYFIEVFNDTAGSPATFFWETGSLDAEHGGVGAVGAPEVPGVNWEYDSTIELSVRITVASPNVDCNGDGIIDACEPPIITLDLGEDRELAPDRTHAAIAENVTVHGGVQPLSYFWEVLSGPSLSGLGDPTAENPSFTPPAVGTYVLKCTVTDSSLGPCSVSDEVVVSVQPLAASVDTTVLGCVDSDTNLLGGDPTATGGTPPYVYSWTVLSGPSAFDPLAADLPNPTIRPVAEQDYDVQVNITDSSDPPHVVASAPVHISVARQPAVSAGAAETHHPIVVIGDELQLGGDPTAVGGHPPYTYEWSIPVNPNGAGTISDPAAPNPVFVATDKGAYQVRLRISDAGGCADDTQFTVSAVTEPPSSSVPFLSASAAASSAPCGVCGPVGVLSTGILLAGYAFAYAGRRWSRRRDGR
jgi:hypothetical protein